MTAREKEGHGRLARLLRRRTTDPKKENFPVLEDHPIGQEFAQLSVESSDYVHVKTRQFRKEFKNYRWNPDNPTIKPYFVGPWYLFIIFIVWVRFFANIVRYGAHLYRRLDGHVLDVLLKIKAEQDSTSAYRWSCREGICGSCSMNIDGLNTVACLKPVDPNTTKSTLITPLPHMLLVEP
ncbi:succinate dehydrogenase [Tripterygium wilfordii]|uniref:Succinate dehydrogenase n=1 Tax=Tripterygium wilfordii TaxID=458696 RepID=A0A7J7DLY6_TRIWF|nr:succinate dehydrogenase [Tripterygium wilfordii]